MWLVGIATTGLVLFNVAVVRGVAHAEPAVVAVAVACVPVVLASAGPLLQGHAPPRRALVAALVVTAGAVLIAGTGRTDALGVVWALVTLACESFFTLLAVPVLPRLGPGGVSVHSMWIAALMFAGLSLIGEGPGAVSRLTATEWAAAAYMGVIMTPVAFVLWYSAVASLGPGRAGLLTGLAPASAAVTGILVGTEAPAPLVWVGMSVVAFGLVTGLFSPGSRHDAPSSGRAEQRSERLSPANTSFYASGDHGKTHDR